MNLESVVFIALLTVDNDNVRLAPPRPLIR